MLGPIIATIHMLTHGWFNAGLTSHTMASTEPAYMRYTPRVCKDYAYRTKLTLMANTIEMYG